VQPKPYSVTIEGRAAIDTRAIIIATGAQYRKPVLDNLLDSRAPACTTVPPPMEAQLCAGEEVIVVGGGNSAGQAAVFPVAKASARCSCSSDRRVWLRPCLAI
jgi:thioredoxin reductase (NADPH)